MTLEEALVAYGREHLGGHNDWYQWRPINPERLPPGIELPEGSEFDRNVALKRLLALSYASGNLGTRQALTSYYIAVWGGVKGNSADTLNFLRGGRARSPDQAGAQRNRLVVEGLEPEGSCQVFDL